MQILNKDINNLAELQRRKEVLKAQLAREKAELIYTVHLVREDMKPENLVKNAVSSFLGIDDMKETPVGGKIAGALRMPLSILTDVLIGNRRLNFLVKSLTPAVLDIGPKLVQKAGDMLPEPGAIYGKMRESVAGLRKRLHKKSMKKEEPAHENDNLFV